MSSLILIVKAMSLSECGDPPYKKRMVTKIAYENSLILCTIITTTPYPPPTPQLKPSLPHNYCCNIAHADNKAYPSSSNKLPKSALDLKLHCKNSV